MGNGKGVGYLNVLGMLITVSYKWKLQVLDLARTVVNITCMYVCTSVGPGQQPVGAANIPGRPMAPTVSVSAQGRPSSYKYTANMRNPPQPMPVAQQPPVQQVCVNSGALHSWSGHPNKM
jgi:hypothetical protein